MAQILDMKDYWRNTGKDSKHGFSNFATRDEKVYECFFEGTIRLLPNESKILEVGCSVGGNLNYFYRKGFKNLVGVDINAEAIEYGKELFPHLSHGLFAQDAVQFLADIGDDNFDLVFTIGCLQNIPKSDEQVFYEMSRTTKSLVLVKEPDPLIEGDAGIFSSWNYEEEFSKVGLQLISKKVIPNNKYGSKPTGTKVPVLRVFAK